MSAHSVTRRRPGKRHTDDDKSANLHRIDTARRNILHVAASVDELDPLAHAQTMATLSCLTNLRETVEGH